MKIAWTEPGVECSLAVYWRSEDGNSVDSRFATLVDLKRASEVAGMLHDYVDRDEAFEREQKLKVRLAVLTRCAGVPTLSRSHPLRGGRHS